jgi:hypothetical protein
VFSVAKMEINLLTYLFIFIEIIQIL